jgi:hypothetical protein
LHVCPICGCETDDRLEACDSGPINGYPQHRCDPKTLARIDGQLDSEGERRPRTRTVGQRLTEGFRMLREVGDA